MTAIWERDNNLKYRISNSVFVLVFITFLCVSLVKTDIRDDAVSVVDNRALAASPLSSFGTSDFSSDVDAYLNDRIGFRSNYIRWYEIAHDVVFNMLIHPFYMYGKNKEVFATYDILHFDDKTFLTDFSDFVLGMQNYCLDNDILFVFQWEPDKSAIKTDLLPKGLNYDSSWPDYLFGEFDQRGINYVNNILLLKDLNDKGISVYNHKYDAGHYNDNGAYYSVNSVLENLYKLDPAIHVNSLSEIEFNSRTEEKLIQSDFVINEVVPSNTIKDAKFKKVDKYVDDMYIDPTTQGMLFEFYENSERKIEGSPRALIFGGSHMDMNYKYCANSFSECLFVPNYTNVINYEYYIEKYNPDVVIFEVCQRTIGDSPFPIYKKDELKANIEEYESLKN